MKNNLIYALISVIVMAGAMRLEGAITAVDFEGLPDSFALTSLTTPGVSFSSGTVVTAGLSLNELDFPPHSGTNAAFDSSGPITLNFSNQVSQAGGFFTHAAPVTLSAFDSSGALLLSVHSLFSQNTVSSGNPSNEFIQVLDPSGRISSLQIQGDPAGNSLVLDDLTFTPTVDPAAVASALFSSVPMAYAQRLAAVSATMTTLLDLNGRLFRHRARAEGDDSGGDISATGGEQLDGEGDGVPFINDKRVSSKRASRWSIFSNGGFGDLNANDSGKFLSLRANTWAGTAGAEYALSRAWTLGAGIGGLETFGRSVGTIGGFNTSGITLSSYVNYVQGRWWADLLYGASLFNNHISRNTPTGIAQASTGSAVQVVDFNTGWNFTYRGLITGPTAELRYTYAHVGGYTENGGGVYNTSIGAQHANLLTTNIGWQCSFRMPTKWGAIVPQIRAAWDRQWLDSRDGINVALVQQPFSSSGTPPSSRYDSLLTGAGVMFQIGSQCSVLASYDCNFLSNQFTGQAVRISIKYRF